ncbi:Indolepyruvate ferredoxin oxidoreductase [Methanococcus vannielii SB]|jgi:indolepyruvate ferredoxin oxidoreductase beta subunit|uniref:Indolepyruvate ferredoxin oxidoreductase n=1 Tax=Methanococcus vannielii (strain ATCC 35089 / DSM 1224 / JCM 13029 / OCM 148 / SB) TaxID=406327 RepID=A6URV1_METVS|nr:indolepyruvate oxidoreductase subunit beta [Methanococcus vannielii]ABR55223.1 Indolepyruvate ferredoxin oxidoreductase [Methanococcus vannielii SB]
MSFNVLICGVGGQGIVLASRLVAVTAMNEGYTVNTAETIGMSQREGSVVSHVRFGNEIKGSLIPEGFVDVIVGFEPSEVLRNIKYLKKGGKIIMNSKGIFPVSKSNNYKPEKIIEYIIENFNGTICMDFTKFAEELGNSKSLNVIMLGALFYADFIPISFEKFLETVKNEIPEKYLSLNISAAKKGAEEISKFLEGKYE